MHHVRIEIDGDKKPEYVWDLDETTVRTEYIEPWERGGVLLVNGRRVKTEIIRRLQVFVSTGNRAELEAAWHQRANQAAAKGFLTFQNHGELWLGFAVDKTREFQPRPTTPATPAMPAGPAEHPHATIPPSRPPRTEPVDVLIITALKEEYDEARKVDAGSLGDWETDRTGGFEVAFRRYATNGAPLHVALTWATRMRMTATAEAAGRLIDKLTPRCLAMCGVCAGRRGKVYPGDVIIGSLLYSYDTGALIVNTGKKGTRNTRFQADPNPYPLDEQLLHSAQAFRSAASTEFGTTDWLSLRPNTLTAQSDWVLTQLNAGIDPRSHKDSVERCPAWPNVIRRLRKLKLVTTRGPLAITNKGRTYIDDHLLLHRGALPMPPPWSIHVASIGTGSSVMRDATLFERLSDSMRDVLGIDMEANAIGAMASARGLKWIVMKGVMDHADDDKEDNVKAFAARAAAECLFRFLRDNRSLLEVADMRHKSNTESATGSSEGVSIRISGPVRNSPIQVGHGTQVVAIEGQGHVSTPEDSE